MIRSLLKYAAKMPGWWGFGPAGAQLEPNCDVSEAHEAISTAILGRRPFLASRLGYTEAQCVTSRGGICFPSTDILGRIHRYSGVFPPARLEFFRFGKAYLDALEQVDLLGLIGTDTEGRLVEKFAPQARRCSLGSLEPYFCPEPWSRHLKGLRVCVVHPFVDSIRQQYGVARAKLFPGTDVLPEFELRVVRPPQTIAGNTDGFSSWSSALDHLTHDVLAKPFDVAVLGCGAYGLPLGARLKAAGHTVIHLGGATQMLFGVSGARWRENPAFDPIINEAWRPPLESERPPGWDRVENGCYW